MVKEPATGVSRLKTAQGTGRAAERIRNIAKVSRLGRLVLREFLKRESHKAVEDPSGSTKQARR